MVCSILVFTVGAQEPENNTIVGFEITVNYVEGEPETFRVSDFSLLRSYSLTDVAGREIQSFDVRLFATLKSTGVITSWQVIGSIQSEVYKSPETVPKTSAPYQFDLDGTEWLDGEEKELKYFTLTWSQVEAALTQFGEGSWSIQFNGNVNLTVGFADGSKDTAVAEAHASMPFTYVNSGVTQFSLAIDNGIQTLSLVNQVESIGLPGWTLHALFLGLTILFAMATGISELR